MAPVVIPALWLLAGLCVHAGVSHFLIGARRPRINTHVLFGIQCLVAAMGAWTVAARYSAATVDDYIFYSRFANIFVQLFFVFMPWVVAAYTATRPRWPAAILSVAYFGTLLSEIFLPYGLLFAERPVLVSLRLPWGDIVTSHSGAPTFFLNVFWMLHAALFVYIGWACWNQFKRGQRRSAVVLGLSVLPFAVTLIINILVSFGVLRLVFVGAFGFVAMVLLMSWTLGRELQLKQDQNQAVLDNVPAVIWIKDLDGRYVFVNQYYERTFGLKLEDVAGKTDYDLFSREVADMRVASDRQVLATDTRIHVEERVAFDHGQRILLALKFPLLEANGNHYALCGISTDITDNKRTSDAMRALAQSASAENGTAFFDDCVQQLARTYRADHAFILLCADGGTAVTELATWPPQRGLYEELSMRGTLGRQIGQRGGIYVEKDAQQRFPDEAWLRRLNASGLCVAPLVSADQRVTGMVGVTTTQSGMGLFPGATELLEVFARRVAVELERISALKALRTLAAQLEQRVSERTRELEAFSYSVSHDLRTPLRAIDGFTSLVLESLERSEDGPSKEHLLRVRSTVRRMETLIDDLLQLARVARHEISKERVDLSSLIDQSVTRLREQDVSRNVDVIIAPGMNVYGDPRLIAVVVDNLVGNAWKYTSRVSHAMIEAGATDIAGARAYFVRDNGVGFDPAHADRLFQAFQRLHDPGAFSGTGVGLAIVARIIERHNGKVWGESVPGSGATFYFTLPQH